MSFDDVMMSLLVVFIIITRRGWVRIMHPLWDSWGYFSTTAYVGL